MSIACIGAHITTAAASFTIENVGTTITLTGEIEPGDAERLASIFLAVKPIGKYYFPYPRAISLNSPGGDVAEAIRISELVKVLGLKVYTKPDGKGFCASSCFLIYVAALERSASGIDTIKTEGVKGNLGPLGVHRPFMRAGEEGPSGVKRQAQIMNDMRTYLVNAGVGHSLIDKMMSHASNDIYWLTAEDIRALGQYSPGLEEQLIKKCDYNARREASLNARDWIQSLESGVLNCVSNYMVNTYEPLKNTAVERMHKRWRPWK